MPLPYDTSDDRLPFKWGPCSNGEFDPEPVGPLVREATRRAMLMADTNARRLGIPRRRFLTSLGGAAVSLLALNACSKEKAAQDGKVPGGSFRVSEESSLDSGLAASELMGEEFIMDVQTHFVAFDDENAPLWSLFGAFPQAACEAGKEAGDFKVCYSVDQFLEEMFVRSDTDVAVISALPIVDGAGLSSPTMEMAKKIALALCPEERVLMHGGAYAHAAQDFNRALLDMNDAVATYPIAAWKIYTMVGSHPFYFDDHDPNLAQIGQAFIDHVREIGPKIICTHRGFKDIVRSTDDLCSPIDIGPAAARNADIRFVVYHSGYEPSHTEGPYSEEASDQGTNRLIHSLLTAGVEPNSNVYAELGGLWWSVMRDPDKAAHVVGKLLKYVGEDRVVWGTDSIWFGTPQDQIQAFRTFEISQEFQERYGYPAITDEIRAKVFGQTSASLYGVEPASIDCKVTRAELQQAREEMSLPRAYGPSTRREFLKARKSHDLV